jgi:hypothetical protein
MIGIALSCKSLFSHCPMPKNQNSVLRSNEKRYIMQYEPFPIPIPESSPHNQSLAI